ncbi:MAG: glycosyltransferase [Frankiales bacterium]|nr:glycosyltransferase [Frankiales bacterium]
MKFALYHPWTYLPGGVERLLVELVSKSSHDWTIWTHHYDPDSTFPELRDMDVRELNPRVSVRRSLGHLVKAARTIASTEIPDVEARALLVSSEGLGDFIVNKTMLPAAAYCHTPLKILHDPVTRAALSASRPQQAAAVRMLGPGFTSLDRRMWRRYRHAFVNSHETLRRCETAGLIPNGRMELLYPGVDMKHFHEDGAPREDFLLVAGRIMWQKNIELAIDVVRELERRGRPTRLVIAGGLDDKSRPYLAQLRARAASLNVEFVLNPTDERLTHLYSTCAALVYTPPNEDFGIVPLEAMACGAPVLAVGSGGPTETVANHVSGWLLDNDVTAFADVAEKVLERPAWVAPMRSAARLRAAQFRWDTFTSRIDAVMEAIAVEPAPVPEVPAQLRWPAHVGDLMSAPAAIADAV